MAQAHPYHQFFNSLAAKEIDVDSDTFKMVLLTNLYTPNLDTHQFYSSVSSYELPDGNGYTTGGNVISGVTTGLIYTNDVQIITAPISGSFTVTAVIGTNEQTSASIAYNATAAVVEAALQAMPNIGLGNVVVTGEAGGPWTCTFTNTLGGQYIALMAVSAGSVAHATDGQGVWNISGGNVAWSGATFASPDAAHYGVICDVTPGSESTDPLVGIVDFITDQTPVNGTLSVSWDPAGMVVVQVS